MNNITVRATFGTTDSYETRNVFPERPVSELIEIITREREEVSEYRYNLYSGGAIDDTMATINCYRPGYIRHDCIKLQFESEENCRAFEDAIKPLFDDDLFAPRKISKVCGRMKSTNPPTFFDTVDIDCPFEKIVLTDFELGLLYLEVWG